MEQTEAFIKKLIELMGFTDFQVESDREHRHATVFIRDHVGLFKEHLPLFVEHVNHVAQLVAKKHSEQSVFVDVNNYRRERENLIAELARAAARKVLATKENISLPAMNSYERRVVHTTLAAHPEVETESVGSGKARYVVVRLLGARDSVGVQALPESSDSAYSESESE